VQTFGVGCVTSLLDVTEVNVWYESEVTRLRRDARTFANADVVAFVNATILTMEYGNVHQDLINGGTVVLRGGLIDAVGRDGEVPIPTGALVVQTDGGE
jgi:hypothetical protein